MSRSRRIRIEVQEGDVLEFPADVLALKYAQSLYGADLAVYELLSESGREALPLPSVNAFKFISTEGIIAPENVLFVGVPPLRQFRYQQIREFGRNVLISLAVQAPLTKHLALTIHGPGYGLDEVEAFQSEVAGVLDAIATDDYPLDLSIISFVERNHGRSERLKDVLGELIPGGIIDRGKQMLDNLGEQPKDTLRTAGYTSAGKPRVFVAMPFADSMDDLFHYGIQGAVNAAGFLCERADISSFVGDVMEWVKQRITGATLVIADLSTANPNVYLEVGYAWGCGRPTVLLVRDTAKLEFDARGQKCLTYKSIRHLEEILCKELKALEEAS
ncbi:MAG TPA: hypothetical protein VN493_02635 [Thermoanaerobaculia bacterium]|nr:hypothetical protein [Thermoanaerobaculia bacterium]